MLDRKALINCKMKPDAKREKPMIATLDCKIAAWTSGILLSASSIAFSNPNSFRFALLNTGTCPVLVSLRICLLLLIAINASRLDPTKLSDNPKIDNISYHLPIGIIPPKKAR